MKKTMYMLNILSQRCNPIPNPTTEKKKKG